MDEVNGMDILPSSRRFLPVILLAALTMMSVVAGTAENKKDPNMSAEHTPLSNSKAVVYRPGAGPRPAAAAYKLESGPHLFIDDFLIVSSENVRRVVQSPQRDPSIPNPLVTGKEDGCFQPYMTVIRDQERGRFRLWFGHRTEDANAGRSHLGYLESADGIRWERPARVLADPAPIQFGVSIIDDGPGCPDAARRFKYGWWMDGGLNVAGSPDGLTWMPLAPGVVLRHNHDINSLFHDPLRQRYVATVSVYRPGEAWSGQRRITMQSYSPDLLTWTSPHYVILPDPAVDQGETQFYAMEGYLVRGGLTIGMVKVLRDDLKADNPPDPPEAYGVGYTALAWTRDGETWVRDPEHFFDPDPRPGAWDHAHAWMDEQVVVGDEVYLYYGGYAHGHKVNRFEERQIGLVKMPLDRYVAREAGEREGRIVTPLVVIGGASLCVNANAAKGSLRVQLLDEDDNPLSGFTFDDCQPISGDVLSASIFWTRHTRELEGRPVHLEFALRNAALFGFVLRHP